MLATTLTATCRGVQGELTRIECHIAQGLPGFTVIGKPDSACREIKDRVRAAVINSGFEWPLRRMTVNVVGDGGLASMLDLPVAIAVLAASEQIELASIEGVGFIGELGLDGSLRSVPGLVSALEALEPVVGDRVFTPATPAAVNLRFVVEALKAGVKPGPASFFVKPGVAFDFADIVGDHGEVFEAVTVAAIGGHGILFKGTRGAELIARRIPGILPEPDDVEKGEVRRAFSAVGLPALPDGRPYRAPHASASLVSLIGGGTSAMRPGEVTLANQGVLFLENVEEFPLAALDGIRHGIAEGEVRVSRGTHTVAMPAKAMLVASMAECPCLSVGGSCSCSPERLARFRRRVPAQFFDLMPIRLTFDYPHEGVNTFSSHRMREVVEQGREILAAVDFGEPTGDVAERLNEALRLGVLSARAAEQQVFEVAKSVAASAARTEVIESDVDHALHLRGIWI